MNLLTGNPKMTGSHTNFCTTRRSFALTLPFWCGFGQGLTHVRAQTTQPTAGMAPNWSLPIWTAQGSASTQLSFGDLLGQWVYLDFWASWCGPCKQSFPWMSQLQNQLRDAKLHVVAVSLDKQAQPMERFLKQFPGHVQVVWDPAAETAKRFEVKAMPSSFLVNPAGQVVWRHRGFHPSDGAAMLQAIRGHMALS